ncbi:DUF3016 domain-containing protein [Aliidiomarina sp. Khilg15.8]
MKRLLTVGLMLLCLPAFSAMAAETEVTWQSPEKFTDINPGDEHPDRFRERVLAALEETFADLGERLPEDQTLRITVTDLTLAGWVEPMRTARGLELVRVVKPAYEPRMDLHYQLVDADGSTLHEGEANLRGRYMLDRATIRRAGAQNVVEYESNMIERWFRQRFES